MSSYDPYDPPMREHHHHHHHSSRYGDEYRERDRSEPRYVESSETYSRRAYPNRSALVPREHDSELSIEEVRRDFPPPGYAADIRRARSADLDYDDEFYYDPRHSHDKVSRKSGSYRHDKEERTRKRVLSKQEKIIAAVAGGLLAAGAKEVWDRREANKEGTDIHRNIAASAAIGAAGAFASYQGVDLYNKHQMKEKRSTYVAYRGRDGRLVEYYSDDEEDSRSHKGNKSFLENALSAAGLGSAIAALTGGDPDRDNHSHYSSKSRRGSVDSHHSHENHSARMQKAAKASLIAGAAEAFRVAKEPGGWKGEKMKRVITAAAGAATIDAALDPTKASKRHLIEAVVGGLVGNRVLNGSRKGIEEDRNGRSRSKSRNRSGSRGHDHSHKPGLAALATAGLTALGAKKLADHRGRSHSRDRSYDSYDERDRSVTRRSRSRSIVDGARRSLAKIGLGKGPNDEHSDYYDDDDDEPHRRRSHDRCEKDEYYMTSGRGASDGHYDDHRHSRSRSHSRGRSSLSVSSASDLGDSDTDRKTMKKMRRKQAVATGLATIATIHTAHSVYDSIKGGNERHKAVREGQLSPREAKKMKTKAIVKDAAALGLAALSIQGLISDVKEARDHAKTISEFKEERDRRQKKRMEKLKQAKEYGRSQVDGRATSPAPRYDGPRYADGNPYAAAITPPPIGRDRVSFLEKH